MRLHVTGESPTSCTRRHGRRNPCPCAISEFLSMSLSCCSRRARDLNVAPPCPFCAPVCTWMCGLSYPSCRRVAGDVSTRLASPQDLTVDGIQFCLKFRHNRVYGLSGAAPLFCRSRAASAVVARRGCIRVVARSSPAQRNSAPLFSPFSRRCQVGQRGQRASAPSHFFCAASSELGSSQFPASPMGV